MQDYYLVENEQQLSVYQGFVSQHKKTLEGYIQFLKENYALKDLPQAVVWANEVAATTILRQVPLPAYTNDVRMVVTPELAVWKRIYLEQLTSYEDSSKLENLRHHYEGLSENHLLQLVGHELTHWSELFLDDFDDYGSTIWFEEGMVEYISRQYFLTKEEFETEVTCNQLLVELFQEKHGWHSLNHFGKETYDGTIASIFYEYWRSFLTIHQLVEELGSVQVVFDHYHEWAKTEQSQPLVDWFFDHDYLKRK